MVTNQITSFDINFKIYVKKENDDFGNFFDLNGYGNVPFGFKDDDIIFGVSTPGVYKIEIGELCQNDIDKNTISTFQEIGLGI